MDIVNWLALQFSGKKNNGSEIARNEEEFSGLNFTSAIQAHKTWRQCFVNAINNNRTERLDSAEAGRSDCCALGQWIIGAGNQAYGHLAEYRELMRVHAKFHIVASAVLKAYNEGKRDEAFRILQGDFQRLSDQVQLELTRLFAKAKK